MRTCTRSLQGSQLTKRSALKKKEKKRNCTSHTSPSRAGYDITVPKNGLSKNEAPSPRARSSPTDKMSQNSFSDSAVPTSLMISQACETVQSIHGTSTSHFLPSSNQSCLKNWQVRQRSMSDCCSLSWPRYGTQ